MKEYQKLILIISVFLGAYILLMLPSPGSHIRRISDAAGICPVACVDLFDTCFFIAGAIANFVSQGAVLKYLGHGSKSPWLTWWRQYPALSCGLFLHSIALLWHL